jgi:spermidine/putrescine transport system ATP-binding protein
MRVYARSTASGDGLIVIDRLTKQFESAKALANVSLNIRRGEFLSLLGPSGCGKTTLLRTIAGFVEPSSGNISIGGVSMSGVPPHRRPVNMVFQNYALFPHLTVAENVAFGPRRRRVPKKEVWKLVGEALAMVGMEGFASRFPKTLSGGQQQRIALARAIVNHPQVLLLDEPLAALDLKLRKRMRIELKRLHEKLDITFVYVTHDQEEALAMSDRIAVMNQGEVVQLGTGEEIYRNPASRYVADFIGEANLINCTTLEGQIHVGQTKLPYSSATSASPTLMVRPEDMHIEASDGAAKPVALPLTVRDKIFIGQGWRLFGSLETGQEITVELRSTAAADQLNVGDEAVVWWPRERGRFLDY